MGGKQSTPSPMTPKYEGKRGNIDHKNSGLLYSYTVLHKMSSLLTILLILFTLWISHTWILDDPPTTSRQAIEAMYTPLRMVVTMSDKSLRTKCMVHESRVMLPRNTRLFCGIGTYSTTNSPVWLWMKNIPPDTLWLCQNSYWKYPIYSGFTYYRWWFSIAMLNYQRVVQISQTFHPFCRWKKKVFGHLLVSYWPMAMCLLVRTLCNPCCFKPQELHDFSWVYPISIHFHPFPFISIHFHSFPFISIHFHSFPSISIHFHSFPSMFLRVSHIFIAEKAHVKRLRISPHVIRWDFLPRSTKVCGAATKSAMEGH